MKKTLIAALLGLMVSPLALADNAPATQSQTPATPSTSVAKKAMAHKAVTKPTMHKHKMHAESHKLVSEIQSQLHRLGYKVGKIDGFNGKRTRAAVRQFQKDHHHKVTGKINTQLLAQLKAAK